MLVKDFTSGENVQVALGNLQVGDILYLEMPKNTRGVAQSTIVSMGGSSSITVKLQGRVNSTVDWIDVEGGSFGAVVASGTGNTETLTDIQLYPQMRAMTISNVPSVTAQLYVTIGA